MIRQVQLIKHLLSLLFFATLSLIVILSWFRYGYLYGGGDVGLPSYDPKRILEITSYVWWEAIAPGSLVPHGLTSVPLQFFQSMLVNTGIPYFLVQAILFWILLFLMGYGMFWVGLSTFGKNKLLLSTICGLFYMLNPYMMIQIWHRFIHNGFFLAAFLPLFYLFWNSWLKNGNLRSIILFLLVNFLGVYLYGSIAYLLTGFFLLLFVFLKQSLLPLSTLSLLKKVTARFIIGLILWIGVHAWWVIPTFSITPALLSVQHKVGESITTLNILSRQTTIPYTLMGVNPFYLFEQADFGNIYKHPLFLTIMWIPLLFLIPGFVVAIRSKASASWGILLAVALFLSKGAAPPFGFVYIFFFSQIFALGILRNPFEKLGILLPFSLAIIYTFGYRWYLEKFGAKWVRITKIFLASLLFFQLVVFLWPFWTGRLIGKADKLALVEVPKYYKEADNFILNQKKDGKILHLPLPIGEGVAYNWQYGFSGIEPSALLFESLPSVSRTLNLQHVDDVISAASNIFREEGVSDENIIAILQSLNIRFIILHNDIDWLGGFLDDPKKLKKILDGKNFLEKKGIFGDLVVYEVQKEHFKPRIYATSDVNFLSGGQKNSFWPYLIMQTKRDIISPLYKDSIIPQNISQTVILAEKRWDYFPQKVPLEKAISELPAASKILPDSNFYFLIKLKENLRKLVRLGPESPKLNLEFAGKRLIESIRLKEKNMDLSIKDTMEAYKDLLGEIFDAGDFKDQIDMLGGRIYLGELFAKHLEILNTLLEDGNLDEKELIQQAKDELFVVLRESELIPMYDIKVDKSIDDLEYTTYHFQVPKEGEYELLMADARVRNVYPDKLEKLDFQINGEKNELRVKETNGFMSYGKIQLDVGKKEFILAAIPSANLFLSKKLTTSGSVIVADDEIEVSSTNKDNSFFEKEIEPLTSDTIYTIEFEAWIKNGEQFKVQLVSDTDSSNIQTGERIFNFDETYKKGDNDLWNNYKVGERGLLFNQPASSYAAIRFLVEPSVDKKSQTVIFRKIQVNRLLNNPIFLRSKNIPQESEDLFSSVEFIQHSPVSYSGKIKLERPGFIIFSEAYHNGWQLRLDNEEKSFVPNDRYLANLYGNAWFVPERGEYTFKLEFTPQETFYQGIKISMVTIVLVSGGYLFTRIKRWQKRV